MSFVSAVLWVLVAILIVYCLTTYLSPRNKCYTTDVTESSYDEVVKTRDSCSLVYHPQCQHCKTMIPHYLKSSKLMPSIKFFKINAAQHNIPSNITGFPTIIVRKNGNEIGRIVGAQPTSRNIISKIKSLMKNQPKKCNPTTGECPPGPNDTVVQRGLGLLKDTQQSKEEQPTSCIPPSRCNPDTPTIDQPKEEQPTQQLKDTQNSSSEVSNPVLLAQRYHFSVGRTPFV